MRFQFISESGESLGLAMRLAKEGHAVTYVSTAGYGAGIVPTEASLREDGSDVVVSECESLSAISDEIRAIGRRVLGSSLWSNTLLEDEEYMKKLISSIGWKQGGLKDGTHLYITTWFNGANFINTYTSLVYRRLMSGGHGPDIGFSGVISNFQQPVERIVREFLNPLQPVLRKVNHKGAFHIHAVVSGDKFIVPEVSASLEHPLTIMLFENSKTSKTNTILRILDESSRAIPSIDPWAVGVLVTVPPFPYQIEASRYPLGLENDAMKHLWFVNATRNNGSYECGARSLYVTARGPSHFEAVRRAYRTIERLRLRDIQYRNDIGRSTHDLIAKLQLNKWMV